jgi:hypothetical protein
MIYYLEFAPQKYDKNKLQTRIKGMQKGMQMVLVEEKVCEMVCE